MDAVLQHTLASLPGPDLPAMNWARRRQEQLTKPPGSLGRPIQLPTTLSKRVLKRVTALPVLGKVNANETKRSKVISFHFPISRT